MPLVDSRRVSFSPAYSPFCSIGMKVALISDIHLSVDFLPFPKTAADVLVLTGDIARPVSAREPARSTPIPTLYVAGNHEFYGSDFSTTVQATDLTG